MSGIWKTNTNLRKEYWTNSSQNLNMYHDRAFETIHAMFRKYIWCRALQSIPIHTAWIGSKQYTTTQQIYVCYVWWWYSCCRLDVWSELVYCVDWVDFLCDGRHLPARPTKQSWGCTMATYVRHVRHNLCLFNDLTGRDFWCAFTSLLDNIIVINHCYQRF